jgi:hypothetical protein
MPHYRDTETGRFVSGRTYERAVSEGSGSQYRTEFGPKELERIAEQTPDAEDLEFTDENDLIDSGFEADEEDEY